MRMHARIICLCCAAMFLSAGEDGTVRQVDLRTSSRTMTLIGGPFAVKSRHCPNAVIPAGVPDCAACACVVLDLSIPLPCKPDCTLRKPLLTMFQSSKIPQECQSVQLVS